MVEAPDKNSLMIGGTPRKIADICSRIAAAIRSKKRVVHVADRNGVRFKAGNRTVAMYDGERIISTVTNEAIDLSERSDDPRATVYIGMVPAEDEIRRRSHVDENGLDYIRLGNIKIVSKDYEGALNYYNMASTSARDIVPACARAFALGMMDRFKEANKILDECLRHNFDAALVRSTKVEILAGEERFEEIIKFASKCIEYKPYDVGMTNAKFHALFDLGNYREVIAYADRCLAMSDEAVETIKEYAKTEDVKGNKMIRSMLDVLSLDEELDIENLVKLDHMERMERDYGGGAYKTMMYVRKIRALNQLNRYGESLKIIEDLAGGSKDVDQQVIMDEKPNVLEHLGMSQ